jgi:hypothetical protein
LGWCFHGALMVLCLTWPRLATLKKKRQPE